MNEILTLIYNVSLYILATFGSALLIIVTGVLLGRILGKLTSKAIRKANLNGNLRKALGIKTKPQKLAENFVKYSIIGVAVVARMIHQDFVRKFRYAKIEGPSAKFKGQQVGLEHKCKDGDIVEVFVK